MASRLYGPRSPGSDDRWWAAGLAGAAGILYLVTLAPTVVTVFDDSLEFQVVLPTLGIAHPTGYPLYTLVGWLFSRLPIGDWAYRANLLSAVAGAVAVGLLFLAARRLGVGRLAAVAVSVIFAISSTWWSQATVAEVYTLHGLLVALILLLALDGQGTRKPWLALAVGLGLAHHRMILLLIPGLLVFLLWSDPGMLHRPRQLLLLLAAFLAPLLLYLYLPLRGLSVTSLDGSYTNTWEGFWRHVLASDYRAFLTDNPLEVQPPQTYPIGLLVEQMGLGALFLGLVGLMRWGQQPRRWTLLVLVFLANILFAVTYRTADADVFYLPATMTWLLLAAAGLTLVVDSLGAWLAVAGRRLRLPGPYRAWLMVLQIVLVAVVLAQPVRATVRTLATSSRLRECSEVLAVGERPALNPNRTGDWSTYNCGRALLEEPLPQGATIVGLLGEATLLQYFQQSQELRPDVNRVVADAEADRLAAVEQALVADSAAYLTRELAGVPERYSLTAQGPLVRVWPPGQAEPAAPSQAVDVPFTPSVRLVGFELSPVPARGASWLRLQLAWQVEAPVPEALKVSARLLGPDGQTVAAADQVPVHWAYPTTAWRPGETVIDAYDFALPENAPVDSLTPLVILYREADGSEVGRFHP